MTMSKMTQFLDGSKIIPDSRGSEFEGFASRGTDKQTVISTNANNSKLTRPNFSPNSFESGFVDTLIEQPKEKQRKQSTQYQSTYEQSLPSGIQPVFSIKGSLSIDKEQIREIGEEKEEYEESKFGDSNQRIIQEQSFHYKKGIAMAQREISNRQPSNTLETSTKCCTLPFGRNKNDARAKEIVYSSENGGVFTEVPQVQKTPPKYFNDKSLLHLSKASDITVTERFLENGPYEY